jgi:hypothetical protein
LSSVHRTRGHQAVRAAHLGIGGGRCSLTSLHFRVTLVHLERSGEVSRSASAGG